MVKRPASRNRGTRSVGLSVLALLLGSAAPVLPARAAAAGDLPCDQQNAPKPVNPCAPKRDRKCPAAQAAAPRNPCAPKKADSSTAANNSAKAARPAGAAAEAASKRPAEAPGR